MAKSTFAYLLFAAVLMVAWTASAQDDDNNISGVQLGTIPAFPYRTCNTSNGAYRLAPNYSPMGSGKYCFTIQVNQDARSCSGDCCTAGLHKIEFNISSSCVVSGASVSATLNGFPVRVSPSFDRPPSGPVGVTTLKVTQLNLDPVTAQGAELCITLKQNRGRQGCTTLEELCVSSGYPAGTCTAATFDAACNCCPISSVTVPRPPAPSPSNVVPAVSACEVCVSAKLAPPAIDVRPYRYDAATCASIQQNIGGIMNAAVEAAGIPLVSRFAPNSSLCVSGTEVITCGWINNMVDISGLQTTLDGITQETMVTVAAGGDVCHANLEGYTVIVETYDNLCVNFSRSANCILPSVPFPNCTCNTTQGILPYVVSPDYFERNGTKFPNTREYCFTVTTLPASQVVPSACASANDTLQKIEWYASVDLRSSVKGFVVTPAGGNDTKLSPSWGATVANTLKVNLNWTIAEANGGVVCVAVARNQSMTDLCMGAVGQCYVSVFNRDIDSNNNYCCPMYRAEL